MVIDLTAILRVADSFDRIHHGLVRDLRLVQRNGRLRVELDTAGRDAALELWGAERKADQARLDTDSPNPKKGTSP